MKYIKKFIRNKIAVAVSSMVALILIYFGAKQLMENYKYSGSFFISDRTSIVEEDTNFVWSKIPNNSSLNYDDENGFNTEVIYDLVENVISENGEIKNIISEDKMIQDKVVEEIQKIIEDKGKISDEEISFILEENEKNIESSNNSNNEGEADIGKIYVYITGEVNIPGVVILNEGSRIADAINAADGVTSKANISKVNLVYSLEDGMKVNIPNDNDLKNNPNFEYITLASGDGRNDEVPAKNNSSGTTLNSSQNSDNSTNNYKKYEVVNINYATQTELETLPGVGPSLALKIINYRKDNGKFSSIEQIKEVNGIGDSKYDSLKKYITI